MASIIDQEETSVAVTSATSVLSIGSAQWFAVQSLEVIVISFRTLIADSVNSVVVINAKTCSACENFVFTTNCYTFIVGVESETLLTFSRNASSF